ncbi:TPR-like protein [Rickenella mellea]|uniref:TPR-like protein n=1 Tax=Rickenella mellea TaxID=50990 RepID=A0A4Y7PXU8_9AGAM|nr:TPR-like protein [Rickenella mellea]
MATPTRPNFSIPAPASPSNLRPRHSISSSFSLDPQQLVHSLVDANNSAASGHGPFHAFALDPNRSVLPASPLRSSPRRARRPKESASRHPLAQDNTDVFQEDDEDDDDDLEWGMVDRMRLWRHDAMMQHLYDTAAFWGDKILSWTNDPNDAFWLAQIYFLTHQYSRAERLLTRPFPLPENPHPATNGHAHPLVNFTSIAHPTPFMSTNPSMASLDKGKGKQPASGLPMHNLDPTHTRSRLPMGPGAMIDLAADNLEAVSKLVDMSVACRYLAAQCQVRQGKWTDATEMLGEANPFRGSGKSGPQIPNMDGGIKVEASMCHLRGLLMLKLNRAETAKECFMEALTLDVKCYEAFEQLVSGEMMTTDEEWEFVQGLAYAEQTPEDADFMRLIYTARLRKYKHADEHALTRRRLTTEYNLADNPDVLFSFADALYAQFRFADCFAITGRILELVSMHAATMPLHVACMHHLPHLNARLFVLAHEMVEREPEAAMSWYAVGVWYLTAKKWVEARTYFSKTSLMDPRFAPAWIAFAHTFALEGEHDHAVTAYSTCARLFTGSHLPLMFVGMEHIMLSQHALADEALNAANVMCDGDPLLINERGVMAYNHGNYERAVELFKDSLELAQVTQGSHVSWASTYVNLGTALHRAGRLPEARDAYRKVLEMQPRHATALAFLGKIHHLMGNVDAAIVKYHESLSIDPVNGHVVELLNLALEAGADSLPPLRPLGVAGGGEEAWAAAMRKSREREQAVKAFKVQNEGSGWRGDAMAVE